MLTLLLRRETSIRTKPISSRRNLTQEQDRRSEKTLVAKLFNFKAGSSTGEDMEEADGFSEKNGVFLRSEIEETRTQRPNCKMSVDNEQPKRFGNVENEKL